MSADHQGAQSPGSTSPGHAFLLGAEIRRLRRQRGLSQRALVRMIGLSAHSNLSDYEAGRRLPPADIVAACERVLEVPDGYLQEIRAQALASRAAAVEAATDHHAPADSTACTSAASRAWHGPRALAAAGIACLILVMALVASEHGSDRVTAVTGVVHVGDHVATMMQGGWAYGFSGDGVSWIDSRGSQHDGGWPACLRGPGLVRATFGVIPVTNPDGSSVRQVVWVDCRHSRVLASG